MNHGLKEITHDALTTSTGLEKPESVAAPISNECTDAGRRAFTLGAGLEDRPYPKTNAPQGATLEPWAAHHNQEIWGAGPDGTYAWCNQADGTFDDSDPVDMAVSAPREATRS